MNVDYIIHSNIISYTKLAFNDSKWFSANQTGDDRPLRYTVEHWCDSCVLVCAGVEPACAGRGDDQGSPARPWPLGRWRRLPADELRGQSEAVAESHQGLEGAGQPGKWRGGQSGIRGHPKSGVVQRCHVVSVRCVPHLKNVDEMQLLKILTAVISSCKLVCNTYLHAITDYKVV